MLLSSGVIWRHRSLAEFREECPGGDPVLQRRLIDELDEGLDWLESLGAEVTERATGNPRTIGRRFDPRRLTDALARTAGDVRLGRPFDEADVLATGGFGARLARERGLLLRASRWSEGDGLAYGLAQGAELTAGMDEFYGRNLPAAVPEELFVSAAQVYGAHALVLDEQGREFFHDEVSWSETDLVQATARLPESGGVVRRRCADTAAEGARANGGGDRGCRADGRRRRAIDRRAPLRAAPVAEARGAAVSRGAREACGHAYDGWAADRRPGARPPRGRLRDRRSLTQRVPMPAASSPAATAAAWPRRSSSAAVPPSPRSSPPRYPSRTAGG